MYYINALISINGNTCETFKWKMGTCVKISSDRVPNFSQS